MTDHGFGGGKLIGDKAALAQENVVKCISKIKEVAWCHVVLASTMGQEPGDLLWEAEGVNTSELHTEIEKCAKKHDCQILFGSTIILEEDSFTNADAKKHPKVK